MTPEIAVVPTILVSASVMYVTERVRVDVVALMVLVSLAMTGLVTSAEALSGFANLAVVTVWTVLILSAGRDAGHGLAVILECYFIKSLPGFSRLINRWILPVPQQ